MTRYEREIERLARDICWAGFGKWQPSCTSTEYWNSISEDARRDYRLQARGLLFLVKRFGLKRLEKALAAGVDA
jgi:hypothetical protein